MGYALIRKLYFLVSRVVCAAYLVISFFGFYEIRELLEGTMEVNGDTLYVPLIVCDPGAQNGPDVVVSSFTMDEGGNWVTSYDVDNIDGCRVMDYMVNGCAGAIVVAAFAVLVYVVVEIIVAASGGEQRKTPAGMGVIVSILLIQTAVITAGISLEADEVAQSTAELYGKFGIDANHNVSEVESHANILYLWGTSLFGLIASLFILLDSVANFLYSGPDYGSEDDDDDDDEKDGENEGGDNDAETDGKKKPKKKKSEKKKSKKDVTSSTKSEQDSHNDSTADSHGNGSSRPWTTY